MVKSLLWRPIAALLLAATVFAAGCGGSSEAVDNTALRQRMAYLNDMAQVSWVDFEGGDVYVGFDERPSDLPMIVNTAAAAAAKAHGKKVHIYAVKGGQPGWRPGDGPVLCEASVRMGMPGKLCM